jgi:D-alanyl-D-alanine carboxypeptidase/D-alanyl-D-alanine-endopeptidase (penicillin-binding protein 4)
VLRLRKVALTVFLCFAGLAFGELAIATPAVNSVCSLEATPGATIQGQHTKELFEIASVSKMFVTHWALHELGADYRFATLVHITPVGDHVVDIHLSGSSDPFWGRQLTHYLISELHRLGVSEVRSFTFDENFKLRWSVLVNFEKPMNPLPEEIAAGIMAHIKTLAKEYPETLQESMKAGLAMAQLPELIDFTVGQVKFLAKSQFQKRASTKTFVLRSAPLGSYLKEMNVVSNNHVADKLYDLLGGSEKFKAFYKANLGLNQRHFVFVNGSGNSVLLGQTPDGRAVKLYNKATCETLIRVLLALQNETSQQSISLTDVLAVAKTDGGTLSPRYDGLPNAVIAKTGTVDPAVTITGLASTLQGPVYFAVLLKAEGVIDWEKARDEVRNNVYDLITQHGGAKPFVYDARFFMPFDATSALSSGPAQGLALTRP